MSSAVPEDACMRTLDKDKSLSYLDIPGLLLYRNEQRLMILLTQMHVLSGLFKRPGPIHQMLLRI
eukprot:350629-Pelagomonas_calceolata.AAC.2